MPCFLCHFGPVAAVRTGTSSQTVKCPCCGEYQIGDLALAMLETAPDLAFDLGSWVHAQAQIKIAQRIDPERVEWMKNYPRPTAETRAQLYLGAVIRSLEGRLMGRFRPTEHVFRVASWSRTDEDCIALANYLIDKGAFEDINTQEYRLRLQGHILYEEMATKLAMSAQAFVAMWFHSDMTPAFEHGFVPAIEGAGYEPVRVDDGKIDDLIIAEIRRSAFIVADFTGHRGGVYYEAGFAHGLHRPVIFTCRSDELEKLHFDVRQYVTISWDQPADIVKPLQNRILALFGAGPRNPQVKPIP